jgi:hypothetical protein
MIPPPAGVRLRRTGMKLVVDAAPFLAVHQEFWGHRPHRLRQVVG